MERLTLSENDRVLAVVAHPDDVEYGASAAVAKWAEDGVEVAYLLLTHGEHGIAGGDPQQVRETRSQEQRRACDIVGAGELEMLDFTDGLLEHTLELRQAIAAKIREFRPTVVLTQDWSVIAPWGVNQADHRVAGLAAVDAARDAGNEFLYPEAGPRHQANTLLIHGAASLDAHEAYFAALPDHPSGDEIVGQAAKDGGEALGVPLAIAFASFPL